MALFGLLRLVLDSKLFVLQFFWGLNAVAVQKRIRPTAEIYPATLSCLSSINALITPSRNTTSYQEPTLINLATAPSCVSEAQLQTGLKVPLQLLKTAPEAYLRIL